MRRFSMRQIVEQAERGDLKLPLALEVQAKIDGQIGDELSLRMGEVMIEFASKYPDLTPQAVAIGLLHRAALYVMAGYGMGARDFGGLAEQIAHESEEQVSEISRQLRALGKS
jgi:hypothetical protein